MSTQTASATRANEFTPPAGYELQKGKQIIATLFNAIPRTSYALQMKVLAQMDLLFAEAPRPKWHNGVPSATLIHWTREQRLGYLQSLTPQMNANEGEILSLNDTAFLPLDIVRAADCDLQYYFSVLADAICGWRIFWLLYAKINNNPTQNHLVKSINHRYQQLEKRARRDYLAQLWDAAATLLPQGIQHYGELSPMEHMVLLKRLRDNCQCAATFTGFFPMNEAALREENARWEQAEAMLQKARDAWARILEIAELYCDQA